MLDDIREKKTSLTTYILVGLAGIGMLFIGVPFFAIDQSNNVAEVNGQDITYQQFQQAVSNIQREAPELPLAKAESEAIRQLISQTLLNEHAIASGFHYSDKALYETIKARFSDEAEYQRFLRSIGLDAARYESLVRRDMVTQTYYGMLAKAQRSQPVIADAFAHNLAQQRTFSIVRLPLANTQAKTQISDENIQTYYDEHKDELMQPPEVALDYVLFNIADLADPSKVSAEALEKAKSDALNRSSKRNGEYLIFDQKADAEAAQQALVNGTPLSDITAQIDDGSKSGEYGQFNLHSHGEGLSPKADDALFALEKTGDVSSVLDTDYGYMVVIADQIQQGKRPSDAQLRQQLADESAQTRYHELTNQAFDAAQSGADIKQIAAMLGIDSQQSPLFNENNLPQPWMSEADVREQLFGEHQVSVGEMAQPVALDDNQSVFFAVSQRQEAQLPPLADIRAQVTDLAIRATAEQQLSEAANNIAQEWTQTQPPEALLREFDGNVTQYTDLTPGQADSGLAAETQQALFSQSERIAVLNAANGDKLIARLESVSSGDISETMQAIIATQWQRQAQLMAYQGIVTWLTQQADIQIHRDEIQ